MNILNMTHAQLWYYLTVWFRKNHVKSGDIVRLKPWKTCREMYEEGEDVLAYVTVIEEWAPIHGRPVEVTRMWVAHNGCQYFEVNGSEYEYCVEYIEKILPPPEPMLVTVDNIAEKFGIPADKLKIER